MTAEEERTRLICDIARVLRDGPVPDDARAAALTFIGWLARRMPGEPVSMCDLSKCGGYAAVLASNGASNSALNGASNGGSHGVGSNGALNGVGSNGVGSNGVARGPRSSRVPRTAR
jgi:hypothetical protein